MTDYKEKIQLMQQLIDRQEEQIQYLNNELFLCKETKKEKEKTLTKGNSNATPKVTFENSNVATILKGRIKSMKMYTEKNRDE